MPLQQGSPEFGFKSVCFFSCLYTCIHKIISDLRTIREPMTCILYACLFYAKSTVRQCGTTCVLQLLLLCDERTVLCRPLCRLLGFFALVMGELVGGRKIITSKWAYLEITIMHKAK